MDKNRAELIYSGAKPDRRVILEKIASETMKIHFLPKCNEMFFELIRKKPLDLIILDLDGPQTLDCLSRIEKSFHTERPPILLIATPEDATDFSAILDPVKDDYVSDPITESQLKWKIRTMLHRNRFAGQKAALSGNLENQGVADIVQFLEISEHSGWLELDIQGIKGRVGLKKGRIVSAEFGNLSGPDAFYALVAANSGTFHFVTRKQIDKSGNIKASNYALILEALKRVDEQGREAILKDVPPVDSMHLPPLSEPDENSESEKKLTLDDFLNRETASDTEKKKSGWLTNMEEWLKKNG